MPTKNLNEQFVASVRVHKRTTFYDTKAPGLVLRVSPSGSRTWLFVYRTGGRATTPKWLTLGPHSDAFKLKDAREKAIAHRKTVDVDGGDPVADKKAAAVAAATPAPKAFTFQDFKKVFVTFQKGRKKEWKADEQMIDRHLIPAWGDLPLTAINRKVISQLLNKLVGDGLTIGVNRVQALISRIFTVALNQSLVESHPAARLIKHFRETPRDRVLTDDEIRTLDAKLSHEFVPAEAVRLRLLLGQRGKETAAMLWDEVDDLDAAAPCWIIGRTRTKNQKGRHSVPLPPLAVEVLRRRRAAVAAEEPRVFPGLRLDGDEHASLSKIHGGAYTWIDLRRTVGTRLAAMGFDRTTRGRVLNHAKESVTDRHYNVHAYDDEKRLALDAWDRELTRILKNEPARKAKVVAIRTRRRA